MTGMGGDCESLQAPSVSAMPQASKNIVVDIVAIPSKGQTVGNETLPMRQYYRCNRKTRL